MRTISIPTSKLIKYIPSEPDGGVIPGRVLFGDAPSIERMNSYVFQLRYTARSEHSHHTCVCALDEELDITESNKLEYSTSPSFQYPVLIDDGVTLQFVTGAKQSAWINFEDSGHMLRNWCQIPNPFDALGKHQLSSFVRAGLSHIACCAPLGLDRHWTLNLAVIKKDANLISSTVIESKEPLTFGPPCQHNVGWLIPWASKLKGINIAWLDDAEMDRFVSEAQPLPKV